MPMKTCPYCGIVPFNHVCPVKVKAQHERDSKREDKKIYWTNRWRKLREDVLEEYKYICLYSFFIDGVIKQASNVHHIILINDNMDLAYNKSNLITLNTDIHRFLHSEMDKSEADKIRIQKQLFEIKDQYTKIGFDLSRICREQLPPTFLLCRK